MSLASRSMVDPRSCVRGSRPLLQTLILVVASIGHIPATADGASEAAELVLHGGRVIVFDTSPAGYHVDEALAVRDGRIIALGTTATVTALRSDETIAIDLAGNTVLPGLSDSHMHLAGVGAESMELNLKGLKNLAALLDIVGQEARRRPPRQWITGRGWLESEWEEALFPKRSQLDAVAPEHPVWLRRVDGHGAVANSLALRLAGIDRDTADPAGGKIVRDGNGRASGMLLDAAQTLVERHVPSKGPDYTERCLIAGAAIYAKRGWTGVQVAGMSQQTAAMIESLVASRRIPIRAYVAIYGPGAEADQLIAAGPRGIEPFSRFTCRTIKVVYDGALGSGGAAMLEPYIDPAIQGRGILKEHLDPALTAMLAAALRQGIQVQTHAIGDRANRRVLDLYEAAFRAVPASGRRFTDPRFRIEHAQIVHADDRPRFAKLGVIPSMQPSHAITDLHFAAKRVGYAVLDGAYAWRTFVDSGCQLAGGSDAPVEAGDPWVEFYAAVTRRDLKGFQGRRGWHPELRLTRIEALKCLSCWSAHAAFQETWRGSIEVGMAADLTVIDRDILTVPASEIPKTHCLLTVVGGSIVHDELRKPSRRQ